MGGVESDYSVCPRPFLQFLQFCQFMLVRLRQVMSGYIRLHQITLEGWDVELDNIQNMLYICLEIILAKVSLIFTIQIYPRVGLSK